MTQVIDNNFINSLKKHIYKNETNQIMSILSNIDVVNNIRSNTDNYKTIIKADLNVILFTFSESSI